MGLDGLHLRAVEGEAAFGADLAKGVFVEAFERDLVGGEVGLAAWTGHVLRHAFGDDALDDLVGEGFLGGGHERRGCHAFGEVDLVRPGRRLGQVAVDEGFLHGAGDRIGHAGQRQDADATGFGVRGISRREDAALFLDGINEDFAGEGLDLFSGQLVAEQVAPA